MFEIYKTVKKLPKSKKKIREIIFFDKYAFYYDSQHHYSRDLIIVLIIGINHKIINK